MAQWAKYLPSKQETWSSGPQNPHEQQAGLVSCLLSRALEAEMQRKASQEQADLLAHQKCEPRVQGETLPHFIEQLRKTPNIKLQPSHKHTHCLPAHTSNYVCEGMYIHRYIPHTSTHTQISAETSVVIQNRGQLLLGVGLRISQENKSKGSLNYVFNIS